MTSSVDSAVSSLSGGGVGQRQGWWEPRRPISPAASEEAPRPSSPALAHRGVMLGAAHRRGGGGSVAGRPRPHHTYGSVGLLESHTPTRSQLVDPEEL